MPPLIFENVNPGDLITSEYIRTIAIQLNELQAEVDALSGALGGNVVVPSLYGKTLGAAIATLVQPLINLVPGITLDPFGNVLDPDLPALQSRLVIGQSPPAKARVTTGSVVNILIAAEQENGGPGPSMDPFIDSFDPDPAFVGETVTISGGNFDPDLADNLVTFDGVSAGLPLAASPQTLVVTVPELPNLPPPGSTILVTVVVSIPGQIPATAELNVGPPQEDRPAISTIINENGQEVLPGGVVNVGENIQIIGENFSDDLTNNLVTFGETDVEPNSGSSTELFVGVPQLPGHSGANPIISTNMVVITNPDDPDNRLESDPFSLIVFLAP